MMSQLESDRDELLRLRVLGVRLEAGAGTGREPAVMESDDIDRDAVSARLEALNLCHGGIQEIRCCVASRPVALAQCADGAWLLIKWPHRDALLHSDNEEFWLATVENLGASDLLRSAMPRLLATDPETGMFVLDGMAHSRTMGEALTAGVRPSTEQWVRLAAALASMHQLTVPEDISADRDRQSKIPIPTSFHLTPWEYAHGCGADFAGYVATIQSVAQELTDVRLDWRRTSLIHFDLTTENILIGTTGPASSRIRLIDWELAGVGDPMYDIGSVLSQLIGNALRSSGDPWAVIGTDAARLITTYREVVPLAPTDLLRAVRYAGFAQLLAALGRLERIGSLGKLGNLSLLIGRHTVTRPEAVADVLFGSGWDQ